MNFEEQVMKLLKEIQERQVSMEKRQENMDKRQENMEREQKDQREILDKTAIIQENEVLPKIDLCLENQVGILDKMEELAPLSRLRETEMDVSTLKNIVKEHSKKLKAIS